ncbi:sugar nucleotide-binding protein [Desulfogranum marinum]|uniref:SDR family oxidoreductase n=1 Tax=Desulfogranum marinum TaxID=453220 RepID=UPI0029C93E9C|nr:sugar nucleotide-binding protein [Desulfogranum marinum]
MKLLIIGANGQLGQDCLQTLTPQHTVLCCDVQEVDITDAPQVAGLFATHQPEAVINCAAYTAVDACETDQQRCMEVNAHGPQLLAEQCDKYNSRIIQISTDYVYDGKTSGTATIPRRRRDYAPFNVWKKQTQRR